MNPELIIKLNKFSPRPYQLPLIQAIENNGLKRIICVMPRRAGKDITAFNIMIRQAFMKVGAYYYILPTHKQARLVLFEGMTSDSKKFLDYIPPELIEKVNIQEMKIRLINGSVIYFLGSNNYDSLRGSNPCGIVFSEYAYQHPQVYPTLRPILLANDGWAIFLSTPFGENHFYQLFEVAKQASDWFSYFLTVEDTQHITAEQIEHERREGIMSEDMIQQEYYCSFSVGAIGSYYAKYLNRMELNDQVGDVPWESGFKVHTAWDLGMSDDTVILFFQNIGTTIRIIDMYRNSDVGLDHYVNIVLAKPYTYGKHIGPHDLSVRDYTAGGMSRWEKAKNLGVTFTIAPDLYIIDGIESVRTALSRIYIDKNKCKLLVTALRDYRKEYDSEKKVYRNKPLHDHNSHVADALRYLAVSIPKTKEGMTYEDVQKIKQDAYNGNQLPRMFRDDR